MNTATVAPSPRLGAAMAARQRVACSRALGVAPLFVVSGVEQFLILALITVAVAATIGRLAVATNARYRQARLRYGAGRYLLPTYDAADGERHLQTCSTASAASR